MSDHLLAAVVLIDGRVVDVLPGLRRALADIALADGVDGEAAKLPRPDEWKLIPFDFAIPD